MPRIVVVGEGMIEDRAVPDGSTRRHYGGDTLNTAIHLARMGVDVAFATAVGEDAASEALAVAWESEGLDCSLVLRHPTRTAGSYRIDVDAAGERTFSYDRSESAAREMFSIPDQDSWRLAIAGADLLVFSLISLAILPPDDRQALLNLARSVRARGGGVAFDGNYRPRLWSSPEEAQYERDAAIGVATIGLPTLEDETSLSGETEASWVLERWRSLGCEETIVKLGPGGCLLPDGTVVEPKERLAPVDTSGAGDAFNAGYLASRLRGVTIRDAARAGHRLAGWTIMRSGAIPARDGIAPYA